MPELIGRGASCASQIEDEIAENNDLINAVADDNSNLESIHDEIPKPLNSMYPTIIVAPDGFAYFDDWAPGRVRMTPDRPLFTPTPEASPVTTTVMRRSIRLGRPVRRPARSTIRGGKWTHRPTSGMTGRTTDHADHSVTAVCNLCAPACQCALRKWKCADPKLQIIPMQIESRIIPNFF